MTASSSGKFSQLNALVELLPHRKGRQDNEQYHINIHDTCSLMM